MREGWWRATARLVQLDYHYHQRLEAPRRLPRPCTLNPHPTSWIPRPMYRHLVRTIRSRFPQYLSQPFDVAELHQTILPYRHHRRELGLETNEDYEITLTELLSGARDYMIVDDPMRDALRAELATTNPDPSAFKQFAAARASRYRPPRCEVSPSAPATDPGAADHRRSDTNGRGPPLDPAALPHRRRRLRAPKAAAPTAGRAPTASRPSAVSAGAVHSGNATLVRPGADTARRRRGPSCPRPAIAAAHAANCFQPAAPSLSARTAART